MSTIDLGQRLRDRGDIDETASVEVHEGGEVVGVVVSGGVEECGFVEPCVPVDTKQEGSSTSGMPWNWAPATTVDQHTPSSDPTELTLLQYSPTWRVTPIPARWVSSALGGMSAGSFVHDLA